MWFTIGGALFFGTYDYSHRILENVSGKSVREEEDNEQQEKEE